MVSENHHDHMIYFVLFGPFPFPTLGALFFSLQAPMTAHLRRVYVDLPILTATTLTGRGEWERLPVEGLDLRPITPHSALVSSQNNCNLRTQRQHMYNT